jgi:hypothetical protein
MGIMTTLKKPTAESPPPPLWQVLAQFWGLSERQTRQSWSALYRARLRPSSTWRLTLCHFEGQHPTLRSPERVWHFLATNVQPQAVVDVIEALISEGLLSRGEGGQIEEAILGCVGREGDWAPPATPGSQVGRALPAGAWRTPGTCRPGGTAQPINILNGADANEKEYL